MSKIMQNLIVLMEPYERAENFSLKGGNMCLNRFCIDEDAAFELSGVHYLEELSENILDSEDAEVTFGSTLLRDYKGKGY